MCRYACMYSLDMTIYMHIHAYVHTYGPDIRCIAACFVFMVLACTCIHTCTYIHMELI